MKKLRFLILTIFTLSLFVSCIDDDNDELTGDAATGGLVNVNNALISYVVGQGATYTAKGSILQGENQTTEVNIYNSFTNSVTGVTTDEVLLTTVSISDLTPGSTVNFDFSFTYDDLISGLSSLPSDDSGLNIGDFWTLRYESSTSDGYQHSNASTTKVSVGTRYAGVYLTYDSAYWNSGSYLGNWDGEERIIESVDATIYRHVGLAFWDDNEFFFTVDNETGVITVLEVDLEGNGVLLNTSPIMTCAGGQFEMIPCDDTTNLATPDDVNGEDQLEITVGYFRGTGATREFYERLVKVVE